MNNLGYKIREDVVIEILSRLPVKTFLRFKCVSKTWFTIIISHSFSQKHLNMALADSNKDRLLIVHESFNSCESFFALFVNGEITLGTNLSFGKKRSRGDIRVTGSCHGLFCIHYDRDDEFLLWNPATREIKDISNSSIPLPRNVDAELYQVGFGFDSNTRDYKVVKLMRLDENCDYHVEVYTLSTNSWRKIEATVPDYVTSSPSMLPTYWNGTYYWWGERDRDVIICFDMCIEQFDMILLPTIEVLPTVVRRFEYHCFTEYNGSLGVIFCFMNCSKTWCELWTMKGKGAEVSWTKQYFIGLFESRLNLRPLMILKSKIILFTNDKNEIIPYDHVTKTMQAPFPDDSLMKMFKSHECLFVTRCQPLWITRAIISYKESLVRI
ncbi:F-box/kelch-repeat protein [Forsythia ovata]|uniref:F-box/kelch-repeat protein n=1 Tax=Forsythia ovata TaxID=205694 RepID=A0ABD1NZ75_9LAMI